MRLMLQDMPWMCVKFRENINTIFYKSAPSHLNVREDDRFVFFYLTLWNSLVLTWSCVYIHSLKGTHFPQMRPLHWWLKGSFSCFLSRNEWQQYSESKCELHCTECFVTYCCCKQEQGVCICFFYCLSIVTVGQPRWTRVMTVVYSCCRLSVSVSHSV